MQQISKQPAFELGQIVATPGALAALKKAGQPPGEFLTRHVNREWGDLSDEDRKENDYSLEHGFRLLSAYRTNAGETTFLTSLARFISDEDRILLIEDTSEIHLEKPNLVRFEARQAQPSLPGVTIRDLLKASL